MIAASNCNVAAPPNGYADPAVKLGESPTDVAADDPLD